MTSHEKAQRPTRVRWVIFALSCAASWLLYVHRYTFNIIKPELARQYGYSETQLGTLFGLFYVTYGIGQIPSGILCDLSGSRLFLAAIIALWSLSLAASTATGNPIALGSLRLLFGGAQAGAYPILAKVSRTWFPRPQRTMLQGLVATTSGRLGGALSPIIMATFLMGIVGLSWQMAVLTMTIVGLLFAGVFAWLYRESPAVDERVNDAERELISSDESTLPLAQSPLPMRTALRNRSLMALSVQQGLAAGADAIYVFLMGSFFLERYGENLGSAGLYASLPLLGGAVGGMVGGWLNDVMCRRFGRRWGRPAVGSAGPLIAAGLMLVVIRQETAIAAGLGLMAVKFFVDWNQPTVWGAATDLGRRHTGTAFAIVNSAGTIGAVLAPPIFGYILDSNASIELVAGETVRRINYVPLFITIAGIYLTSSATWWLVDCNQSLDGEQRDP